MIVPCGAPLAGFPGLTCGMVAGHRGDLHMTNAPYPDREWRDLRGFDDADRDHPDTDEDA